MAALTKELAISNFRAEKLVFWKLRDSNNDGLAQYMEANGDSESAAEKLEDCLDKFSGSLLKLQIFEPANIKVGAPKFTWRVDTRHNAQIAASTAHHEHPSMMHLLLTHIQSSNEQIRQAQERAHAAQLEALKAQFERANEAHDTEGVSMKEIMALLPTLLGKGASAAPVADEPKVLPINNSNVLSLKDIMDNFKNAQVSNEQLAKLSLFAKNNPGQAQELLKYIA